MRDISVMPKTEITKFKNEIDSWFKNNIKINIHMRIKNIFIETTKSDFE